MNPKTTLAYEFDTPVAIADAVAGRVEGHRILPAVTALCGAARHPATQCGARARHQALSREVRMGPLADGVVPP